MSIKHRFVLFLLLAPLYISLDAKSFILLIDPAGHAHDTGRRIDDVFERSISLACAQQLKHDLENRCPHITVLFTRNAGETIEPLQNANFANRLGVDLFIRLQFFHEQLQSNSMTLYHFAGENDYPIQTSVPSFIGYDKAHLGSLNNTKRWVQQLEQTCNLLTPGFCKGIFAFPCHPLIGITAPAFCIEIGLSNKNEWHICVNNLSHALCAVMTTMS